MKVAVLSDIHGNYIALQEILKDAKKQGVDEYIVLGDLVTDFPAGNEVIEILRNLTPYVIKGNKENYLINYEKTRDLPKWNTIQNSNIVYYYENINENNREYIRNLPETMSIDLKDFTLKAVHGSPFSTTQGIYFDKPELIDDSTKAIKEDVLACGHTHLPARRVECNNKVLVSVGAVGMHNHTQDAQYVILEKKNGVIEAQTRNVVYEKEKLKDLIKQSGILEKYRIWANLAFMELTSEEGVRTKFIEESVHRMDLKYYGKDRIREDFYGQFNVIDDDIYLEVAKDFENYFVL